MGKKSKEGSERRWLVLSLEILRWTLGLIFVLMGLLAVTGRTMNPTMLLADARNGVATAVQSTFGDSKITSFLSGIGIRVKAAKFVEDPSKRVLRDWGRVEREAWIAAKPYGGEMHCGCKYKGGFGARMTDGDECGYTSRTFAGGPTEVTIGTFIPAAWIGGQLSCWTGHPECPAGTSGANCCALVDEGFKLALSDIHNLFPGIEGGNLERGGKRFALLPGAKGSMGQCDARVARHGYQPRGDLRGDIARVAFYLNRSYGVQFAQSQWDLFRLWAAQDPVSPEELARDDVIRRLQGTRNPYLYPGGVER